MLLPLVLAPLVSGAAVGLTYLFFYGGFDGPVDWAMNTASHGSRGRPVIALTFDDGPDPERTPALLDALADLRRRARSSSSASAPRRTPSW